MTFPNYLRSVAPALAVGAIFGAVVTLLVLRCVRQLHALARRRRVADPNQPGEMTRSWFV